MNTTVAVQNYASGDWHVIGGSEDEFITRWTEFLDWTKASAPGLLSARLIRDADEPSHFVSFAEWESLASLNAWRGLPDFATKLGACRALCKEFRGTNYKLAVQVP